MFKKLAKKLRDDRPVKSRGQALMRRLFGKLLLWTGLALWVLITAVAIYGENWLWDSFKAIPDWSFFHVLQAVVTPLGMLFVCVWWWKLCNGVDNSFMLIGAVLVKTARKFLNPPKDEDKTSTGRGSGSNADLLTQLRIDRNRPGS